MTLKTTVVGAGAIGGLLAAALLRAGHTVSILARGATLVALRERGLQIISEGVSESLPVRVTADPEELGVQDFVILALKSQALPQLAPLLTPLIGPGTTLVGAMNGVPWWFLHELAGPLRGQTLEMVDPGGRVSATMPPQQSAGCVVHLAASSEAPGVVRRGRGNQLILGTVNVDRQGQIELLSAALKKGGFDATVTQEIRREIWIKLWGNMNMNPISALTGATVDRILDDPYTHALVLRMMEEAAAVGAKLGLDTGMTPAERSVITRKLGAFKTSMLQDAEAGRTLELEAILGVFPELGRKLGVPTPYCDAIYGLLRQRQALKGAEAPAALAPLSHRA
jgi:2-dehydropantoate 2-reductase